MLWRHLGGAGAQNAQLEWLRAPLEIREAGPNEGLWTNYVPTWFQSALNFETPGSCDLE